MSRCAGAVRQGNIQSVCWNGDSKKVFGVSCNLCLFTAESAEMKKKKRFNAKVLKDGIRRVVNDFPDVPRYCGLSGNKYYNINISLPIS